MKRRRADSTDTEKDKWVARRLDRLRELAPPPKYDVYEYLGGLHDVRCELMKLPKRTRKAALRNYAATRGVKLDRYISRQLVDLTVGNHVRNHSKDKYALTVDWGAHSKIKPGALKRSVKRQGGINSCVDPQRKIRTAKNKSRGKPAVQRPSRPRRKTRRR